MRPSKDLYFLSIAEAVSKRSTCLRHKVGAVIVGKGNKILSTGYNGAPSGMRHCLDIGCMRDQLGIASGTRHEVCRAVHAEQNAIIQAASNGATLYRATIYCTLSACIICAKMIVNAGIARAVFAASYPDELASLTFKEAGVEVIDTIEDPTEISYGE